MNSHTTHHLSMLSACGDLSSTVWLQCCSGSSTPVGTQYHTAVSTLAICLQPPTTCALNMPAPTLNPTMHTYIQCSAVQYNIQQYTIQTIPYAQYCCYLTLLLLLVLLSCTYSVSPHHFLPPGDFSPGAHAVCCNATHRHP